MRLDAPAARKGTLLRRKGVIWAAIVLPGLWPAWPIAQGNPTVMADPLKYILHHTGLWACLFLVFTLALTPLRVLFPGATWALDLNRHRRLIGVASFGYASLHLSTHVLYEGGLGAFKVALTKPFLLSGLVAFTLLLVLAVTSLHPLVHRMGARLWKRVHRFVYLAALLVAYHQAAASKLFPPQVLWIFVPLGLLEIGRLVKTRLASKPTR